MEEEFYFTLNIDRISEEDIQKIVAFVREMRGTRVGMSFSYSDPI